jgi:hypothetical protein
MPGSTGAASRQNRTVSPYGLPQLRHGAEALLTALSRSRVLLVNSGALEDRMEENQRFRELAIVANPLENRLFLASVTMPCKGHFAPGCRAEAA